MANFMCIYHSKSGGKCKKESEELISILVLCLKCKWNRTQCKVIGVLNVTYFKWLFKSQCCILIGVKDRIGQCHDQQRAHQPGHMTLQCCLRLQSLRTAKAVFNVERLNTGTNSSGTPSLSVYGLGESCDSGKFLTHAET